MNTPSDNLHIVLLSAGLSQRLGFAKQLILKNGITLLEEKIRLALSVSKNVTVVTPNIDTPWAQQVYAICRLFPVQIVPNPTPHTGMAQSIQFAFASLQKQHSTTDTRIVFLTIDQFALNTQHLSQLTQVVDSHTLIASRYHNTGEPAVMGIPVNVPFGFLATFAPQLHGDKGFGKILNQLVHITTNYHIIPIDIPELAWDIDTPEQFEQLQPMLALSMRMAGANEGEIPKP